MKKATKFVALLLAVVLAFSLAACTKSDDEGMKVDVFWYKFSDAFLTTVRNAMIEELDKTDGITYTMHDCEDSQAKQNEKVETAITQGTDLLVVNIQDTQSEEAAQNIANLAKENDIPIIFFNREVSDAVVNSYDKAMFVGTDADEAGVIQGEAIANFLLDEANWVDGKSIYDLDGDDKIDYVMFRGELGNKEAFGRTLYSVKTANEKLAGKLTLVPSAANATDTTQPDDGISQYYLYGNWDGGVANGLMATALTTYSLTNGDIELVIANNDDQALGVIEALNDAGFNTGKDGDGYIPVFGVDATADAQSAISAGKMTGSVLQDAVGMAQTIVVFAAVVRDGGNFADKKADYNVDADVYKIRIPYKAV